MKRYYVLFLSAMLSALCLLGGCGALPQGAAGSNSGFVKALTPEEALSRRGRRSDRWEADWSD